MSVKTHVILSEEESQPVTVYCLVLFNCCQSVASSVDRVWTSVQSGQTIFCLYSASCMERVHVKNNCWQPSLCVVAPQTGVDCLMSVWMFRQQTIWVTDDRTTNHLGSRCLDAWMTHDLRIQGWLTSEKHSVQDKHSLRAAFWRGWQLSAVVIRCFVVYCHTGIPKSWIYSIMRTWGSIMNVKAVAYTVLAWHPVVTRSPAVAEGPRDALSVEIW